MADPISATTGASSAQAFSNGTQSYTIKRLELKMLLPKWLRNDDADDDHDDDQDHDDVCVNYFVG